VAVLANGLDTVYPPHHALLSRQINANGALVSEFPLLTKPLPQNFPRRNRIISGLCLGTLVIEAAAKSGSLITAKYALEQNREVFAAPGPVSSPQSAGCHALIQDGAKLVTCIEDILVELNTLNHRLAFAPEKQKEQRLLSSNAKKLQDVLEYTPTSIEMLIEKSGLTPDQVSSMLIELELSGHVICDAYGSYSRSQLE